MNLEKFTDRAKGFLQSAQTVAIRMNHQRIGPEHLLKALLEDSEGMASELIRRAGGNVQVAVAEVDRALAKDTQERARLEAHPQVVLFHGFPSAKRLRARLSP